MLSSRQLNQPKVQIGVVGEARARAYLTWLGYRMLDQNVGNGHDEFDLVAFDPKVQEVVFVEVKTRSSELFGWAETTMGWRKRRSQRRLAQQYLAEHHLDKPYRFDIIAVLPNALRHSRNVSW